MPVPRKIWRSKLWAKRGDKRIIIHVIAEADFVGFRVDAVPETGRPTIMGSGTALSVVAARLAAERLAKQSEVVAL